MKKLLSILLLATSLVFGQPYITGTGTSGDPYLIWTAEHIDSMRYLDNVGVYFKLMADIDMSSYTNFPKLGPSDASPWRSYINGNGKTISNLTIDSTGYNIGTVQYYGFIGFANMASQHDAPVMKNIKFDNFTFNLDNTTGVGDQAVGGLIGRAYTSADTYPILDSVIITNLNMYVEINLGTSSVYNPNVGGAVAQSDFASRYRRVHIEGNITVESSGGTFQTASNEGFGGLFGHIAASTNKVVIDECAFIGNLTYIAAASGNAVMSVGGIIADPNGWTPADTLKNSYVRINKADGDYAMGGLVGYQNSTSGDNLTVFNCYAVIDTFLASYDPAPDSSDRDGYIVGYNITTGMTGQWISTYADTENVKYDVSGDIGTIQERTLMAPPGGSPPPDSLARTTAQMTTQSNYVGWDFDNVWKMTGSYPFHLWNPSFTITLNVPNGGETYIAGDTINVDWTPSELDTFKVYISYNNGADWTLLSDAVYDSNYIHIAPNLYTATARVLVTTADSSYSDESFSTFSILPEASLDILYPIEATVTLTPGDTAHVVVQSLFVENLFFYWSNDSTNWHFIDSTAVDTVNMAYFDTTAFVWTFNGTESGPEVWIWVKSTLDTNTYVFDQTANNIGDQRAVGNYICQTLSAAGLIEQLVIYDPSCGWTSPPRTYYAVTISNDGTDYDIYGDACAHPYTTCAFPRRDPISLVSGSDTTEYYLQDFYTTGTTVTYKQREYFVYNQALYCNDLFNGIDSIFVSDLSSFYVGTNPVWEEGNETLAIYNVPRDSVSGRVFDADFNFESLNPALFKPLIIVGMQNTSVIAFKTATVEALEFPVVYVDDIEKVFADAGFLRYYFRGIHPKAEKR